MAPCTTAENHGVRDGIAAQPVIAVDASCYFTRCIQARDWPALQVQYLRFLINGKTADDVMGAGDNGILTIRGERHRKKRKKANVSVG